MAATVVQRLSYLFDDLAATVRFHLSFVHLPTTYIEA